MKYFNFIKRDLSLKSIIYNRVFLYIVLFVSFINMTAYGLMGDIITPLVYVLVGVITAYYNKNMLVILLTSLVFSNIVKYGNKLAISMEGFSEGLTTTTNENELKDETNLSTSENTMTTTESPADTTSLSIKNTNKTTSNNSKVNVDGNIETNKKVKIIKEELNNIIQDLESKVNTIYTDLDKLQQAIKNKTSGDEVKVNNKN